MDRYRILACQPADRKVSKHGDIIRRGNSDDRIWRDAQAVEWLSTWMTLGTVGRGC